MLEGATARARAWHRSENSHGFEPNQSRRLPARHDAQSPAACQRRGSHHPGLRPADGSTRCLGETNARLEKDSTAGAVKVQAAVRPGTIFRPPIQVRNERLRIHKRLGTGSGSHAALPGIMPRNKSFGEQPLSDLSARCFGYRCRLALAVVAAVTLALHLARRTLISIKYQDAEAAKAVRRPRLGSPCRVDPGQSADAADRRSSSPARPTIVPPLRARVDRRFGGTR